MDHYYELLEDSRRTWPDAHQGAKARTYRGWYRGYLAYLETSEENTFVENLKWGSTKNEHWIGLRSYGDQDYKVIGARKKKWRANLLVVLSYRHRVRHSKK